MGLFSVAPDGVHLRTDPASCDPFVLLPEVALLQGIYIRKRNGALSDDSVNTYQVESIDRAHLITYISQPEFAFAPVIA
jgi:hypothetical protein